MEQPTALVTGATDGIGRATAFELARRGYYVIVHGRTPERVDATCAEIARATKGAVGGCIADLSLYDEVHDAAQLLVVDNPAIDVLVNNAGVLLKQRQVNQAGHEMTLAVNHLGPFLFTHLLLPVLRKAPQARVINVSSGLHASGAIDVDDLQMERDYDGMKAYANSKLANVLFTFELARRLRDTAITVNALHPGVVGTKLLAQAFGPRQGRSADEGATLSVKLATDPALAGVTGRYFVDGQERQAGATAYDEALARRFYEASAKLVSVEALPG